MTTIIAAIITGGLSFLAVFVSNNRSNQKMQSELEKQQAVTDTKIEELTREVREHNSFARRMPVLENKIESAERRLDDIEKQLNK